APATVREVDRHQLGQQTGGVADVGFLQVPLQGWVLAGPERCLVTRTETVDDDLVLQRLALVTIQRAGGHLSPRVLEGRQGGPSFSQYERISTSLRRTVRSAMPSRSAISSEVYSSSRHRAIWRSSASGNFRSSTSNCSAMLTANSGVGSSPMISS